ncbi:hypothetical protein BX666DRAFT_1071174 [Dichotomocladium elegans]|nr:hypothetical protein BX666DRAFT_1071174 [Dichotomocladium elegans]
MAAIVQRGRPVEDYDIPSTIVVYILVCLLAVGMCFCMRRANRLLPNQLSFQLRPTGTSRTGNDNRRYIDEEADVEARRGLLSEYDNDDDNAWGESAPQQDQRQSRFRRLDEEVEPFGELQSAETIPTKNAKHESVPRAPVFNIADEDDNEEEEEDGDPDKNNNKDQIRS